MRVLLILRDSFPTQLALAGGRLRGETLICTWSTRWILARELRLPPPTSRTPHELQSCSAYPWRSLPTWRAYRNLSPIVAAVQPDLVHVLHEPWSVVVSQVVHTTARAVVTHGCENLWDQGGSLEAFVRSQVIQRNLNRTNGFVSWNSEGVSWARRRGLPCREPDTRGKFELPDLARFEDPASKRETGRRAWGYDQEVVFGYVGRLIPAKGIDWLLKSWEAANLPDGARLVFVGQGPMEGAIRTAATVDTRIRLIGPVLLDHIPTVMASLDSLVLPSLTARDWCRAVRKSDYGGYGIRRTHDCQWIRGRSPRLSARQRSDRQRGINGGTLLKHCFKCVLCQRRAETFPRRDWIAPRLSFSPAVQAERISDFWQTVTERAHQR